MSGRELERVGGSWKELKGVGASWRELQGIGEGGIALKSKRVEVDAKV